MSFVFFACPERSRRVVKSTPDTRLPTSLLAATTPLVRQFEHHPPCPSPPAFALSKVRSWFHRMVLPGPTLIDPTTRHPAAVSGALTASEISILLALEVSTTAMPKLYLPSGTPAKLPVTLSM